MMKPLRTICDLYKSITATILLLVVVAPSSRGISIPQVFWAQRRHILYLKVQIPDLDSSTLDVKLQDSRLQLRATSKDGEQYSTTIDFFRRVESRTFTQSMKSNEVNLIIYKFWEWRYWPRLLRDAKDPFREHVKTDWKRWKDDDVNEEPSSIPRGEDTAWWDEDLALHKVADFKEDQFDNSALPLLNETNLKQFVASAPLTSVLFFKRSFGRATTLQNRATYKAYAIVAATMARHGIPIAAVDGATDVKLLKRMHITSFPTARVFFEDGSMHTFDPSKTKSSGGLIDYLLRQREPAWAELNSTDQLVDFLRQTRRTALGVFGDEGAGEANEAVFDKVAKEYQAKVEILPVSFAKVSTSLLMGLAEAGEGNETVAALASRLNVTSIPLQWNGLMMVKQGEPLLYFGGRWSAPAVSTWVGVHHFNAIEYVTPANLAAFQRRQLPMMVIVMDGNSDQNERLLGQLRPIAEERRRELLFLATHFNSSLGQNDPWVKELKCQFAGTTFAVLDDHLREYRYCLETSEDNPLSDERVRGMVAGYFSQVLQPSGLTSEPVPDPQANVGPVFKVVTDTLMDAVMVEQDVVIHFYAKFDKEWEDQEDELQKFGEATEDLGTLVVAKMDGSLNQQPPEFPDIGFYPCTWLWPRNAKSSPVRFNSTLSGFRKHALMEWAQQHVTDGFKLEHGEAVPLNGATGPKKQLQLRGATRRPSFTLGTQPRDEL